MTRYGFRVVAMLAVATTMVGCGSNSGYATTSPSTTTNDVPAGATVVSIVGSMGSGAFSPNPVQASVGAVLVWKNTDAVAHHIVLDNGSADLGTVAPGATTRSFTVTTTAATGFHCTIHPSMVGTINGALAPSAAASPYLLGHPGAH